MAIFLRFERGDASQSSCKTARTLCAAANLCKFRFEVPHYHECFRSLRHHLSLTFTARLSIIKVMLLSDSITEKTVQEHIFPAITHASAADDVRKQLVRTDRIRGAEGRFPPAVQQVLAKRLG